MTGIYRLADLNIEIVSCYPYIHDFCRDYRIEETSCIPDFTVRPTQAELEFERRKSAEIDAYEGLPERNYPDDWLEMLVVHRMIAEKLPDCNGFLLHGSAVAVDGECFVFTAKSGTGKSTHTRLWRELLGERAVMVNDDKPLVRVTERGTIAYGTPWNGKHCLGSNVAVPLKALCILERGEENRICEVGMDEMLPKLLLQAYRPMNPAGTKKLLDVFDRMDVRFYRMQCNMDISAAELAYTTMKG
ncbi:MAG: hypothetical protein IKO13_02330 [Oscillospiraceae bacterium]|nr:hypothetical protein [Oscillospiraceae bacterium]